MEPTVFKVKEDNLQIYLEKSGDDQYSLVTRDLIHNFREFILNKKTLNCLKEAIECLLEE